MKQLVLPSRRNALVTAAILLVSTAVGWSVRAADPAKTAGSPAARPALTVTVVRPEPATLSEVVSAGGSISAWQEALIGSESNGWRLAEVRASVGDRVRRGQVLAVFGTEMAQAELEQSRATLAEAEANLIEARANGDRARNLQTSGALSAQQITQFLTAERGAMARVDALNASVHLQQIRLAQARVLAPDDGVISARSATVGAVLPAGTELFRLIRQGRLEWRAEVTSAELARIQPRQRVLVTPAGGATVVGVVRQVAPTVDVATRNGLVYVDLPAGGSARAGMFARGEFELGSGRALTLPQSALMLRDGFSFVFRVGPGDQVALTKVQVGRRAGDRIEITGGLDGAMPVVASGAGFLHDGDRVRVVPSPAPATAPAAAASGVYTR